MLRLCSIVALTFVLVALAAPSLADEPTNIGSRLELFVDDYLIKTLSGDAKLQLQKPEAKEVVLVTGKPWEGNTCAYYTIFQDGDLYRMYYRGSHWDEKAKRAAHPEVTCYAESKDGIRWTKPELGLFEFDGSKNNNIVISGIGTHCFAPFKDQNPDCAEDAQYKAIARGPGGLYVFKSPDAIHWSLISDKPVITKGAFDSQNLAFWDPHAKVYREYHRAFRGVRDIMTGTSTDFVNWTEPQFLEYPGAPKEHLYTNAIRPYERAPHILLGFPTRFLPNTQQVEPTFMTSRNAHTFNRWTEALIPINAPEDRDGNRSNYMAWGLVHLPDAEKEYSVYATEAYYTGPDSRLRRFTYRVDGFVSVQAPASGGKLVTKPVLFDGKRLVINFRTVKEGHVRIGIQDAQGQPIDKFTLADCQPIKGDEIAQIVQWQSGADTSSLAGKPIQLVFDLQNADVFSFRFAP